MTPARPHRRILVIDDNLSIHDDFRRILTAAPRCSDLDAEADLLLGASGAPAPDRPAPHDFELEFAAQGQQARDLVCAAQQAGRPFALAFVDMRMPPGWDGVTTIGKLWEIDPQLHIVICTAHSDRTWDEIERTLEPSREQWAVLKKPFDRIEVVQLAAVMVAKWNAGRRAA